MSGFGGITDIALTDAKGDTPQWLTGGIRSGSTFDPDFVTDEETTGDAFGGANTPGSFILRSQADYATVKGYMENEDYKYLHVRYNHDDSDVEVSDFPVKVMVRKETRVNATDGKRGMVVTFRRVSPANLMG